MPLLPGGAGLFVFLCFSRFFCSASLRSAALLSSLSSLSSLFARRRGRRRDRRRCAARVAPPGLKFHFLHSGGSRRSRGASPPANQGTPLRGSLSASLRSAVCSRFVLFCVFFPIGLIGLIGLIIPIGLIALGFLRERVIALRGFAPLRGASPPANQGSPLRGFLFASLRSAFFLSSLSSLSSLSLPHEHHPLCRS